MKTSLEQTGKDKRVPCAGRFPSAHGARTNAGAWRFLALALVAGLCLAAQAQRTATAIATVINGFVVAITITDGGAGYTEPPTVTLSGGGGSGATATALVSNGAVSLVNDNYFFPLTTIIIC
jgi:4-hydroxybenzoate polyprenyltransferase